MPEKKKEIVKENQPSFRLDFVTFRLLQNEPFFGALSRRINKTPTKSVPTAGVRLNRDSMQFELFYNPDFMGSLTEDQQRDVLKHEFFHIVFEHVQGERISEDAWKKDAKRWNIACDLAINSHLDNLPDGCYKPGAEPCIDIPEGKASEWYFQNMPEEMGQEPKCPKCDGSGKEKCDSCGGTGKGQDGEPCEDCGGSGDGSDDCPDCGGTGKGGNGQFDDHDFWSEATEAERAMADARAKDIIRKASQEASARGWGTVPADCQKQILDMLTPTVNWRTVLRYFIKTSQRANKTSTVKRVNRKYRFVHPGSRIRRQAKIAIAIDQSGSVGDNLLATFFSELDGLAQLAEFTVIPFDSRVVEDKIFVWKKGERRQHERVSCGGTCFDAPTQWINEQGDFDGLIILTDMEAPKPVACKAQRMWMTHEAAAKNPYFSTHEKVVAIKCDNPW